MDGAEAMGMEGAEAMDEMDMDGEGEAKVDFTSDESK